MICGLKYVPPTSTVPPFELAVTALDKGDWPGDVPNGSAAWELMAVTTRPASVLAVSGVLESAPLYIIGTRFGAAPMGGTFGAALSTNSNVTGAPPAVMVNVCPLTTWFTSVTIEKSVWAGVETTGSTACPVRITFVPVALAVTDEPSGEPLMAAAISPATVAAVSVSL